METSSVPPDDVLIEDLDLSTRARNVAHGLLCYSLGELADAGLWRLLRVKGCGLITIQELVYAMGEWGVQIEGRQYDFFDLDHRFTAPMKAVYAEARAKYLTGRGQRE